MTKMLQEASLEVSDEIYSVQLAIKSNFSQG